MDSLKVLFICIFYFQNSVNCILGQNSLPASISSSVIKAKTGDSTNLSCESFNVPLHLCLWEKLSPGEAKSSSNTFLISFNPVNTRPGVYSGANGYSYKGDGLSSGHCGLQIDSVEKADYAKWQCTLFTETNIYRGFITLNEEPRMLPKLPKVSTYPQQNPNNKQLETPEKSPNAANKGSVTLIIPDLRDSRKFQNSQSQRQLPYANTMAKPLPIITAQSYQIDSSNAFSSPEAATGVQVSEVKVESAQLEVKRGKLQVF